MIDLYRNLAFLQQITIMTVLIFQPFVALSQEIPMDLIQIGTA